MITGAKIIRKYETADTGKRIDIICKYYPCFVAIVEDFIDDLEYDIVEEQCYNRRVELGDLGVKVQTSKISNPTQDDGIRNVELHKAILSGDFSGGELDDTNHGELFIKDAALVRTMLDDFGKFKKKVDKLQPKEKEMFGSYLQQEISLTDIAESSGTNYESAKQKVRRIKVTIKNEITSRGRIRG